MIAYRLLRVTLPWQTVVFVSALMAFITAVTVWTKMSDFLPAFLFVLLLASPLGAMGYAGTGFLGRLFVLGLPVSGRELFLAELMRTALMIFLSVAAACVLGPHDAGNFVCAGCIALFASVAAQSLRPQLAWPPLRYGFAVLAGVLIAAAWFVSRFSLTSIAIASLLGVVPLAIVDYARTPAALDLARRVPNDSEEQPGTAVLPWLAVLRALLHPMSLSLFVFAVFAFMLLVSSFLTQAAVFCSFIFFQFRAGSGFIQTLPISRRALLAARLATPLLLLIPCSFLSVKVGLARLSLPGWTPRLQLVKTIAVIALFLLCIFVFRTLAWRRLHRVSRWALRAPIGAIFCALLGSPLVYLHFGRPHGDLETRFLRWLSLHLPASNWLAIAIALIIAAALFRLLDWQDSECELIPPNTSLFTEMR